MRKFILPLLIVALIGGGAYAIFFRGQAAAPDAATSTVVAASPEPAALAVVADAKVLPLSDVALSFERAGTLAELLVDEGDMVEAGQALARLDSAGLLLQVEQAQVSLERARASYNRAAAGADPEAVAVADAAIAAAQASQAQAGAAVTGPDIAAAKARLDEARAALAELNNGPKGTERTQAQAAVDQSSANLQSRRDSLSAAKTSAELAVQTAANALRDRQLEYERVYWDNRDMESKPGDLPDERVDMEEKALRAVENAETALAQAQVGYEAARQAELEGVASAEAQLRDAQARLDQLVAPADADKVAAAQARIAAAQAELARLQGPARSTQLAAAAASVDQAAAQRAQVAAPPREVDLELARVEVEAAQVALAMAEHELSLATLKAPFAGTVAELSLEVGGLVSPGSPALVLADLSKWQIETEDLTELDVVKLREGDAVSVSFDALPGVALPGLIRQIKPIGGNRQGDIVYTAVIELAQADPRLRWNMTAVVTAESDTVAGR
jgi:HlyD family secretion protein